MAKTKTKNNLIKEEQNFSRYNKRPKTHRDKIQEKNLTRAIKTKDINSLLKAFED